MVFSFDEHLNKNIATIKNSDRTEKYECLFSACDNPVCTSFLKPGTIKRSGQAFFLK